MARLFIAVVLAISAATAAFPFFHDSRVEIRLSESQVLEAVGRKLPFRKTYLTLFDVTLDNPRIRLVDGSDRVRAGLDVSVRNKLSSKPPMRGSADMSGVVRYVPELGEFYLDRPEIETLSVDGIPPAYMDKVDDVLTKAFGLFFKVRPIYMLKDTDSKQAAAMLALKDVSVEAGELVLTLGP